MVVPAESLFFPFILRRCVVFTSFFPSPPRSFSCQHLFSSREGRGRVRSVRLLPFSFSSGIILPVIGSLPPSPFPGRAKSSRHRSSSPFFFFPSVYFAVAVPLFLFDAGYQHVLFSFFFSFRCSIYDHLFFIFPICGLKKNWLLFSFPLLFVTPSGSHIPSLFFPFLAVGAKR